MRVHRVEGEEPQMRHLVWFIAAVVLLVPAVAMQITNEVRWDTADFVIFGGMLIAACLAFEATTALTNRARYRIAGGLTMVATFFVVWLALSCGWSSPLVSWVPARRIA